MKSKNKHTRTLAIIGILAPVLFFISLNAGYMDLNIGDIMRILTGGGSAKENLFVLEFRMPRIVIAMLVGMGLSLAGCVIQSITRNPLADPGILGINAGAGIIVIIFILLNGTLTFASTFALPFLSFLGAALTGCIIYGLSLNKKTGMQPTRLVLNGVAIQAGINAFMTLIVIQLDDTQHDFLVKWQAGSIWSSNWELVAALLPWIAIGIIILIFNAKKLDVLSMGDEISCGLGVTVSHEKRKLLFTAMALAAASVASSGSISFVGLMAPHLSRRLVGARHGILIPTCALVGALLVLAADTVARTIAKPSEIPTGVVVSLLGAPYFICLLISNRKKSLK
ncbi:MAG: feuC 2 [Eubacterium sp.]|nr:feuC 2 [Eubacterium sp.]